MAITKVTISDECTACGLCEETCADVFKVNDTAEIKDGADYAANEDAIREAAENCPVEAIEIE